MARFAQHRAFFLISGTFLLLSGLTAIATIKKQNVTINNLAGYIKAAKQSMEQHFIQNVSGVIQPWKKASDHKTFAVPSSESKLKALNCSATILKFANPPLPVRALASFPGSGNTWTRHLIQELTGYYTGSVYNDFDLKNNGFPGESRQDGSVVVIKTHFVSSMDPKNTKRYTSAILIMRDPYAAMKAEYKRRRTDHTGAIDESKYKTQHWQNFVESLARLWYNFHEDWFKFKGPKLVVFYEEMKSDLKAVLRQFCEFLKMDEVCTEERLECVTRRAEGNFHRKSNSTAFDPYTPDLRARTDRNTKKVFKLLETCVRVGGCLRYNKNWPISKQTHG